MTDQKITGTIENADLIPVQDVSPDDEFEDANYDEANDSVDPEEQGHDKMDPDPGPPAKDDA